MLVQGKRPVSARCGWKWSVGLVVAMTLALMGAASLAPANQGDQPMPQADDSDQRLGKAGETTGDPDESKSAESSDSTVAADESTAKAEKIKAGDVLRIDVAGLPPTVSGETWHRLVEPDGQIVLDPGYGRVNVGSLTPEEAEHEIVSSLEKHVQSPSVQVVSWGRISELLSKVVPNFYRIKPGDWLSIRATGVLPDRPVEGDYRVEPSGAVPLGPGYGRVNVVGLTLEQAEGKVRDHLKKQLQNLGLSLDVAVTVPRQQHQRFDKLPTTNLPISRGQIITILVAGALPDQPIAGEFIVEPGGAVSLGPTYGRVQVEGLSFEAAERKVSGQLAKVITRPEVAISFGGWDLSAAAQEDAVVRLAPKLLPQVVANRKPNLRYSGKSFDEWREVLENDLDPTTRVEALKALGKFGGNGMAKEAAEAIVPYIGFRDGDENVVYATALEEMRKIGEPALPVVIAAFDSPDAKIREAAAHLLTQMPTNEAAIAALVKALDDKVPGVRIAAAGALGANKKHVDRAGGVLDEIAELADEGLRDSAARQLTSYFPATESRLRLVNRLWDQAGPQSSWGHLGWGGTALNAEFMVPLMQSRLEQALSELPPASSSAGARQPIHPIQDVQARFNVPLDLLGRAGPQTASALPTLLKVLEHPASAFQLDERVLSVLSAIGPAAAPTARPVLERIRVENSRRHLDASINKLLNSWDAAAGKQPAVQPQIYRQPTSAQPGATQPTPAQPNATTTIFAGKTFHQWRRILEKDLDPATRATAIAALAKFGANGMAKEAAEAIVPFIGLRTGDEQVVYSVAVQSLRDLGPPATAVVIEALANSDERIRKSAAYLLSELPDDPAVSAALDKALDDKSPTVRVSVAEALAAHKRDLDRAGEALEKAYETGDEPARNEIAEVLMRRFPPTDSRLRFASDYLDRADPRKRPQYLAPEGTKNAEFMVPLMALRLEKALAGLPPPDQNARGRGVLADVNQLNEQWVRPLLYLQRAGEKSLPALPTVLKLTERPDLATHLDGYILQVLRSIGPKAAEQARPALERLRELPGANSRGQIDELLRSWGEQPAGPEAKPQGFQPNETSTQTTEIIRQYAGKTFEQWREVLEKDLDPAVQLEAIAAIKEFGRNGLADEAVQTLVPLLSSQASAGMQGVADATGRVLAELGAPAVPALLDVLKRSDDRARAQAVSTFYYMSNHGDAAAPAAEALILEAKQRAKQPNRLRSAVHAIASIRSRPAVTLPFLKEMAQSTDSDTRLAALVGLEKLKTTDDEVVPVIVESIWTFGGGERRAGFCHSALEWINHGSPTTRDIKVLQGLLERAKSDVSSSDFMVPMLFELVGRLGLPAAPLVPLMVEVAQHDPNWQSHMRPFALTLVQLGPAAKDALPYLKTLRDGQPPEIRAMVEAAIAAIEPAR